MTTQKETTLKETTLKETTLKETTLKETTLKELQNGIHKPRPAPTAADSYRLDDGDGRGPYRLETLASALPRPAFRYEWQGYPAPPNGWRCSREALQALHEAGAVHYPCHADGSPDTAKRPTRKRFLSESAGGRAN